MNYFSTRLILFLLLLAPAFDGAASRYVKLTQLTTENGLRQNTITGLIQDEEGYLWVATSEGLGRFDAYRMSDIKSPNDHLSGVNVDTVWRDSKGIIWIGSDPKNNYRYDTKSNLLTEVTFPSYRGKALEYPVIQKIEEDAQSDLWIATYEHILFYDRSEGSYEVIVSIDDLFNDASKEHLLRDILLKDNYLFIATSAGLYVRDLVTGISHLVEHGGNLELSEDQRNVKELIIDSRGLLLVGTVEGLFTLDYQQLFASFSRPVRCRCSSAVTQQTQEPNLLAFIDYSYTNHNTGTHTVNVNVNTH